MRFQWRIASRGKKKVSGWTIPRRTRRVQVGHDEVPEPSVDAAVVEAEALRGEGAAAARRVRVALGGIVEALPLQDRLVLLMRFEGNSTVGEIARALSLPEKPLFRHIEKLLARLKSELETRGVSSRDVAEALESWDWADWPGNGAAAPVQSIEGMAAER